jgi:hypothetical protein
LVYENLSGGSDVEALIFKDEIIFVVKHWRGTAR